MVYTDGGRLETLTDPVGLRHTYSYDAAGRPKAQVATKQPAGVQRAAFSVSYDAESQVTSRTKSVNGASDNGTWSYVYDPAGRLISATDQNDEETTYAWDGAGNRTEIGTDDGTINTLHDAAGRPVSASDGTTYQHDDAGNLIAVDGSSEEWIFGYDGLSRMVAASSGSESVSYAYDALDRLVQRGAGTGATSYSYAGNSMQLVEETAGTQSVAYSYAGELPLAQESDSGVSFFGVTRPHGDVDFLTDDVGEIASIPSGITSPQQDRR
jgi:YD repeat-containing protein